MTATERMAAGLQELATWAWCLDEVAAGRPLPTFVDSSPIASYPASLRGPHALFPDHPQLAWGGSTHAAQVRRDALLG